MSSEKKQFMFVHIPKTAGTTFALILERHFRWGKKMPIYLPQERLGFSKLDPNYKNKFELSYGHVPFDASLKIPRGINYYTFLRDPRQRLLSGYKYLKGDGVHGIKKVINIDEYSLKDFLKKGTLKNFDNLMVRYLSGRIDKPYLDVNDEDLQKALKNLDTYFPVFGLTEYFDESLVLLSDHMGWGPLNYVRENNSSYKMDPKELDAETEELILKCNKYDQVLYDHAKTKFLKLMAEKKEVIEKGLIALREGNEKHKAIMSLRNRINLFYSHLRKKIAWTLLKEKVFKIPNS